MHEWATRDPERPYLIDGGSPERTLSYAEVDRRAGSVASLLRGRELGSGSRVAIAASHGIGFADAWFGTVYAGCTTLPIAEGSTAPEIAFRLRHSRCSAILADARHADVAEEGVALANAPIEVLHLEDAERHTAGAPPCDLDSTAVAMLLYTSGTTDRAKCACITHASLIAHTRALASSTIRLDPSDRVLGTLPLTHSYGIRTTLLLPSCAGASTVVAPRFSPKHTLELCADYDVTWLPGVPTMFIAWANETAAPTPRSLRWCMSAGAPLPEDVRARAEERLGAPVRQAYGLTEANLSAVNAPPDDAVSGSCGRPVQGVEIRIAGKDGCDVAEGDRGEVLIRGPNVMAGYLDDPIATNRALRDGWLHTGDIGLVDSEGRLQIVDRSKDLILRGGASIYPAEVEDALAGHPDVLDVAVVGRPDPYYGEVVVAFIVGAGLPRIADLDAWARERLAHYKVPVSYARVDALPRGKSGKTLKRRLREQLDDEGIRWVHLSRTGSHE